MPSEALPSVSAFHPDLAAAARWLPRGAGRGWLVKLTRYFPIPGGRVPRGLSVNTFHLSGSPATVRVVSRDAARGPRPVVLWIHGGGYVIGAAAQDDTLCGRIAERLDATVVSVDYRLAPEHPFPAPLDDCYAAYELIHREPELLGIDPTRLVIAGQSAGAGLAAALTLRVHDARRPLPKLQLLVYPMLDDRTVLRDAESSHHRLWDTASNKLGWKAYLGALEPGAANVSDHAAPARRVELRGLPPTWIGVGTLDLFHAENVDYAKRLTAAGVPTTLEIVDGAFHGFDAVLPRAPVSLRFFESQMRAAERALAG